VYWLTEISLLDATFPRASEMMGGGAKSGNPFKKKV